ncbi:MAG: hypothetical protein AAGC81_05015 [Pseudomonadota bacterium]
MTDIQSARGSIDITNFDNSQGNVSNEQSVVKPKGIVVHDPNNNEVMVDKNYKPTIHYFKSPNSFEDASNYSRKKDVFDSGGPNESMPKANENRASLDAMIEVIKPNQSQNGSVVVNDQINQDNELMEDSSLLDDDEDFQILEDKYFK